MRKEFLGLIWFPARMVVHGWGEIETRSDGTANYYCTW